MENTFGSRLTKIMKDQGRTPEDLSEVSPLTKEEIERHMRKELPLRSDNELANTYATILNIKPSQLLKKSAP